MTKLLTWLIRILFWLQAFAGPFIFFGLMAFLAYSKGEQNKNIAIGLLAAGAVTGIILAEWIIRKYGLETFFGRIYGPNEMDEKLKK
ncbi:MAG: hypothetical protein ACSLE0_13310 [Chitinophagaceae bacterium]